MIKESSVRPKPQNNNAKIAFLVTMLLFLVGVAAYMAAEHYRGIIALVAICFLTSSILFYTKYLCVSFYYDISVDNEGTPIFVVRQLTGRRERTLARINIADIKSATMETKDDRKKHKTPYGVLKYNYGPTLNPQKSCRLVHKSRYESSEIIIEVSDEYMRVLLDYAELARAMCSDEE